MSVNYYAQNECTCCGKGENIHIGKSSAGWKFLFNYNRGEYYTTIFSLKEWIDDQIIIDENGARVSNGNFWYHVALKQNDKSQLDFYNTQFATPFTIGSFEFMDGEFC